MILGFQQKFKNGDLTAFAQKIHCGIKIHTLRDDPSGRWRLNMPIQMAYGNRTKNYQQFNKHCPHLEVCTGVQNVLLEYKKEEDFVHFYITVDGCGLGSEEICQFLKNDGFDFPIGQALSYGLKQAIAFFFPKGYGKREMKLIHWTDLRY